MTNPARILSLNLSAALDVSATGSEAWWDKEWRTGFYKEPSEEPKWLGYEGFRSDEQADRRYHGGVDKAVCVYPSEHYPAWQLEFPEMAFRWGAFGENLTTAGLQESEVCIGAVYRVGQARVQISQPRQPCWKLARRWKIKNFALRVEHTGWTGFYFRVLEHGWVDPGDPLVPEEPGRSGWTIQRCNELMHHRKDAVEEARELASVRELSGSWKDSLWARAASRSPEEAAAAAQAKARTRVELV